MSRLVGKSLLSQMFVYLALAMAAMFAPVSASAQNTVMAGTSSVPFQPTFGAAEASTITWTVTCPSGASQATYTSASPQGWNVTYHIQAGAMGASFSNIVVSAPATAPVVNNCTVIVDHYDARFTSFNATNFNVIATPPPPPTGVTAAAGYASVNVSWNPSSGATSYNLYRSTVSGAETLYKSGVASPYSDTAVTPPSTTYCYEATAVNAGGESSRSAESCATPLSTFSISAPSSVSVAQNGSQQVTVTVSTSNGFSGAVNLSVINLPGMTSATFVPSSVTLSGSGSASSTLTLSVPSSVATGTYGLTLQGIGGQTVTVPMSLKVLPANPSVPQGGSSNPFSPSFGVTQSGNANCNQNWTILSPFGQTYTFANPAGWSVSCTYVLGAYGPQYLNVIVSAPLTATVANNYEVIVGNYTTFNENASYFNVVPGLTAPTGVTATAGYGKVTITWNPASGATSYNLYRSTTSGTETLYKSGVTSPYVDTSVTPPSTTYYYEVTAVYSQGESVKSTEVFATPLPTYSLSLNPTSVSAEPGSNTGPITATASTTNGFNGAVNLSLLNPPFGITGSFNPASISLTGSSTNLSTSANSTLVIGVASTVASGTYTLVVQAVSGGLTQTATLSLVVGYNPHVYQGGVNTFAPTFGITNPTGLNVANCDFTRTPDNWAIKNPQGLVIATSASTGGWNVTCQWTQPANYSPQYQSITVWAPPSTSLGANYSVIVGNWGGVNFPNLNAANFDVVANPDPFDLSATPSNFTVPLGGGNPGYTLTLSTQNGFAGPVNLVISAPPYGIRGTFGTNPMTLPYKTTAPYNVASTQSVANLSIDPTVAPGTYAVVVQGTSPGFYTASTTLFVNVPPAPPTSLTAAGTTSGITLNWNASSGANAYNVYRATVSGGPYTRLTSTSITNTSFVDTTAPLGVQEYYVVTAIAMSAESGYSNEATAVRLSAPLASAVAGNQQITISWTSVAGATSYALYRSLTPGAEGLYIHSISGTSYTDGNVINGSTYYYKVAALGVNSSGDLSNEVSGTPEGPFTVTVIPTSVNVPQAQSSSAITVVVMTPLSGGFVGSLNLSLYITPSGITGTFAPASVTLGPSTSATSSLIVAVGDYNTVPVGAYAVTVQASGMGQTASATLAVNVTPQVPSAPSGLTGTANPAAPATVNLQWNAPTGPVTGYNIYRNSGSGSFALIGTSAGTTYSDTNGLQFGQQYGYYVTALNQDVESAASNQTQVTLPLFLVTVNPQDLVLVAGQSFEAAVEVISLTGSPAQTVNLSLSPDPGGVTAYLQWGSTLAADLIRVTGNTPGDYTYTLTVSSAQGTQSVPVNVHVIPTSDFNQPRDFFIEDDASEIMVTPGTSSSFGLIAQGLNGFDGSLHLSAQIPWGFYLDGNPNVVLTPNDPVYAQSGNLVTIDQTVGTGTISPGVYLMPVSVTSYAGNGWTGGVTRNTQLVVNVVTQDFMLSGNGDSLSVAPGAMVTTNLIVTPIGGLNDVVSLNVSNLPSGIVVTPEPASVMLNPPTSSAATIVINALAGTPAGLYPIKVTATSSTGTVHEAILYINVTNQADFEVQDLDSSMSGGVLSSYLLLQPVGGNISGDFALSASQETTYDWTTNSWTPTVWPIWTLAGSGTTVNSKTVFTTADASPQVSENASPSLEPGVHRIRFMAAKSGNGAKLAIVPMVMTPQWSTFISTLNTGLGGPNDVPANTTATGYLYATGYFGYSGTITYSASNVPSGFNVTFNPATAIANNTNSAAVMNVQVGNVPHGTYGFLLTATGGVTTVTQTVPVVVPGPGLVIWGVGIEGELCESMAVGGFGGFSGTVTLSYSGLPAGSSVSFQHQPVVLGTNQTDYLAGFCATVPSGTVTAGGIPITITATSGSISTSQTFTIGRAGADFGISASTITATRGLGGMTYVTISPGPGFNGQVYLSVDSSGNQLPQAVQATWSSSPVGPTGTAVLSFYVPSYVTPGTYTFNIQAVGYDAWGGYYVLDQPATLVVQ